MDHAKMLEESKRKELYRDAVKKRSHEAEEEKKLRALQRLEGVDLRSPGATKEKAYFSNGSAGGRSRSP